MNHPLAQRELAGPYLLPARRQPEIEAAAAALALPVCRLSPQGADRAAWLQSLGQQLQFPAWFGGNFDALYDSLNDPELLPAPALVLWFDSLQGLDEDSQDTLIAVLQAVADDWRAQGRALWALFAVPGLLLDPLPAAPAA
jgi:RNAse (barnase) inhibitor barstar